MNHCEFWKVLFLVISNLYNLALDRVHCKLNFYLIWIKLKTTNVSDTGTEISRVVYIIHHHFAYLHLINFSFESNQFVTSILSKTVLVLYIALFKSNINTSNNDYGFCVHHFSSALFLLLLVTFQYSYGRDEVNKAQFKIEATDPKLLSFLMFLKKWYLLTSINIKLVYFLRT